MDVEGIKTDLHSGGFGGAVVNPAYAMAQILAQLKDKHGRVTIPGFYDDVRKLPAEERRALAGLPFREKKFGKDIGAPALFGEKGYSTLERLWTRPTLEINGLYSGFIGEGAKTVLPGRAMAKVSMRPVPNQDPARIARLFTQHVKRICPKTVRLTIKEISGRGIRPRQEPASHHAGTDAGRGAQGTGHRPIRGGPSAAPGTRPLG
jgi:acetylornithine deacetylase/succinyl-diaminopimelate desuccinylase-like protein